MLTLHHLDDPDVREQMVGAWQVEFEEMRQAGVLGTAYGPQLTEAGWDRWADAMPTALTRHDERWLDAAMSSPEFWHPYSKRTRAGRTTLVNYNKPDARRRLCVGEFNTAYIRGLARALKLRGETEVEIYRAGPAVHDRAECSQWEGELVSLDAVLAGHRARYYPRPGDPGAFSVPTGPNCHHSIRAKR